MVSAADNTTAFYQTLLSPAQTSCSHGEAAQLLKQKGCDSLGDCLNYRFLKSPADMYLNINLHRIFLWSWGTDFIISLMSSQKVFKGLNLSCLSSCCCWEIKVQLELQ